MKVNDVSLREPSGAHTQSLPAGGNTASGLSKINPSAFTRPSGAPAGGGESRPEALGVDISERAQLLRHAIDLAKQGEDSPLIAERNSRLADLKNQVRQGTYSVPSHALADRLVEDHLLGNLGRNAF